MAGPVMVAGSSFRAGKFYDRYGNRWGQTVVAGSGYNTQHTFNAASNRISTTGYTFDNSGNLTANGPGTTYGYNQENLLTSAAGTTTYKIDAQDRRVRKTVSGTATDYFYSGSQVIAEKTGAAWRDYIFFGNTRIVRGLAHPFARNSWGLPHPSAWFLRRVGISISTIREPNAP